MAGQYEDVGLRARIDGVTGYSADAKRIQQENKRIEESLRQSSQSMNREASSMLSSLKPLAGALAGAFAVNIGVDAFKGVISAASDLNETVNKVGVVFGQASNDVMKFAADASQSLGMSRNEALGAAATFGNLFKSMGLGETQSADFSTNLLKLSADLASFNNIEPGEVLEKLRSGLVGETEPLRSLGVLIDEETTKNFAYAQGIAKTGAELTQQQKVMARYGLIVAQTATAQGDFANTSTGVANSTRIINASFKDIQAEIGSRLLPLVQPLISGFATGLPSALAAAQPWLDKAGDAIANFAAMIQDMGLDSIQASMQPVLDAFGALARIVLDFGRTAGPSVVSIFGQMGDIVGRVSPTMMLLRSAMGGLSGDSSAVNTALGVLRDGLAAVSNGLKEVADPMGAVMSGMRAFANTVQATMQTLADQALPVIQNVADQFIGSWRDIEPLIGPALDGARKVIQSFLGEIQSFLGEMNAFWQAHGQEILTVTKSVFETVGAIIKGSLDTVTAVMKPILKAIAGDWSAAWQDLQKVPEATLKAVQGIIAKQMDGAIALMRVAVGALRLEEGWYNLRDFVLTVFHNLTDGIKGQVNEIIKSVNQLGVNVNQQLGNLTGGRIKLDVAIPELERSPLVLPERASWFGPQQQTELDTWRRKLADLNATVIPDTTEQIRKAKEATDEVADSGDNLARKAKEAFEATGASGKQATTAVKQALADMERDGKASLNALEAEGKRSLATLATAGKDLDSALKGAEATMKRFANIRLPGQAAAEQAIFDLEQAQAAARLEEVRKRMGEKGLSGSDRIGLQAEAKRLEYQIKYAGQERKIQQARQEASGQVPVEFASGDEAAIAILVAQGKINEATMQKQILEENIAIEQADIKLRLDEQKAVMDEINLLQSDQKTTMQDVQGLAETIDSKRQLQVTTEQGVLDKLTLQRDMMVEMDKIAADAWKRSIPPPTPPSGIFPPETEYPGMATGGRVLSGGGATVGERGPERVFLPAGASVMPAGSGPATVNRNTSDVFNVYDASRPVDVADAVRRMMTLQRITQGRQSW